MKFQIYYIYLFLPNFVFCSKYLVEKIQVNLIHEPTLKCFIQKIATFFFYLNLTPKPQKDTSNDKRTTFNTSHDFVYFLNSKRMYSTELSKAIHFVK